MALYRAPAVESAAQGVPGLDFGETDLPGLKVLMPRSFGDDRGFLSEVYNAERFARAGVAMVFVQDNQS
jgi:dTDP-4-dehydrorhamnose 3,5-epimerase-like enzyme